MSKYIKLFDTHTEYQTYINGNTKVLPNVSYCDDMNEVHYNPFVLETRLVAKFNITDTSNATNIMYRNALSNFSEIEIDGVVQPNVVSSYTFDTTGEHIVKYTLVDPSNIPNSAFYGCTKLKDVYFPKSIVSIGKNGFRNCNIYSPVILPDTITTIGETAFASSTACTTIVFGKNITYISVNAFQDNYELINFTILTKIPPTIEYPLFVNNNYNLKIYVPAESVDAYKAATNWSLYANKIQAIPSA